MTNSNTANAIDNRNGITYTSSSSGLSYYDYPRNKDTSNESPIANKNSKVSIDVKGYLAGRNGWNFIDTIADDNTIRIDISNTPMIEGLKIGIIGNNNDILPMHKGDKRRLIIPSRLGYKTINDEPIPINNDNKRRLYSTVFNNERGYREKKALGDSIVGEIILDVTLKRVKN
jgi:FKBP-type peptidyl-prolyl cis-trans isomerase